MTRIGVALSGGGHVRASACRSCRLRINSAASSGRP